MLVAGMVLEEVGVGAEQAVLMGGHGRRGKEQLRDNTQTGGASSAEVASPAHMGD